MKVYKLVVWPYSWSGWNFIVAAENVEGAIKCLKDYAVEHGVDCYGLTIDNIEKFESELKILNYKNTPDPQEIEDMLKFICTTTDYTVPTVIDYDFYEY